MALQTSYSTAPDEGLPGSLNGNGGDSHSAVMRFNAEASASIDFGLAVIEDTDERGAVLPVDENSKVLGLVIRSHNYSIGTEIDEDGLLPGVEFSVLRKGRMLVRCRLATTKGDRLWVRAVAGVGEVQGACEQADDGTDTIDCTGQGVYLTSCDAGGLAVLEVDFTNEA